jgi:hypothetical protein
MYCRTKARIALCYELPNTYRKNNSTTESYKSANADEINVYIKLCEKYDEGSRLFFDKSFTRST